LINRPVPVTKESFLVEVVGPPYLAAVVELG
jgi:hypothetical protein